MKAINNKEKGIAIYLAIALISFLMAIGLGLSGILTSQLRNLEGLGDSVFAFYAANTGMERILEWVYIQGELPTDFENLNTPKCTETDPCYLENIRHLGTNDPAEYYFIIESSGVGSCEASFSYCIKSMGSYGTAARAIQVKY